MKYWEGPTFGERRELRRRNVLYRLSAKVKEVSTGGRFLRNQLASQNWISFPSKFVPLKSGIIYTREKSYSDYMLKFDKILQTYTVYKCDHDHNQDIDLHQPQISLVSLCSQFPFLDPGNHLSLFCSHNFTLPSISYK